jgi:hypothetical protein
MKRTSDGHDGNPHPKKQKRRASWHVWAKYDHLLLAS